MNKRQAFVEGSLRKAIMEAVPNIRDVEYREYAHQPTHQEEVILRFPYGFNRVTIIDRYNLLEIISAVVCEAAKGGREERTNG